MTDGEAEVRELLAKLSDAGIAAICVFGRVGDFSLASNDVEWSRLHDACDDLKAMCKRRMEEERAPEGVTLN